MTKELQTPGFVIKSHTWSDRLYTGFHLIWAGWVFLVNGYVILDFSPKPAETDAKSES